MSPRLRPPLHDQVTAEAIIERLNGFEAYLEATARDARKACDATLTLTARLTAENTQVEIAKIWQRIETADAAHRADLQNSYARINEAAAARSRELEIDRDLWKVRVEALEDWRARIEGASGLVGWLAKHAPWLVTVAIAVLAVLKVKAT